MGWDDETKVDRPLGRTPTQNEGAHRSEDTFMCFSERTALVASKVEHL